MLKEYEVKLGVTDEKDTTCKSVRELIEMIINRGVRGLDVLDYGVIKIEKVKLRRKIRYK